MQPMLETTHRCCYDDATMSKDTHKTVCWLAGLLSGWGIKESWAKLIAGAIAGALAASGFLSAEEWSNSGGSGNTAPPATVVGTTAD